MADRPFISMVLIAKDEARNIDRCFDSWWDYVDEVVLVDTGSTDGTVERAYEYDRHGRESKLKIGRFDWCDDFSAARNYADSLATGEWLTWCDLDDTVEGLGDARSVAENASSEVVSLFARYDYAQDENGNCLSELWRERITRNGVSRWEGRLHEHKAFTQGVVTQLDPQICQWIHHRPLDGMNGDRNLHILEKWLEDEPDNARVIQSLGMEHMGADRYKEASDMFARYLEIPGESQDKRSQASRYLAVQLLQQGRVEEANDVAWRAARECFTWADTHLSLAECAQTLGDPEAGFLHAETALRIGKPSTLLIVNPLQYTAHPKAVMAVCAAQLGRVDEAVRLGEEVLSIAPTYGLVAQNIDLWRAHLQREQAVADWVRGAQLLAASGELVKAERLLESVPFFVTDDPRVIDARVQVKRSVDAAIIGGTVPRGDDAASKFIVRELEAA